MILLLTCCSLSVISSNPVIVCFFFSLLWLFPPAAVISEHDTSASEDYNDANTAVVFIAHDLSAVEEEHSTDVQSDQDKDKETAAFLSDMYVLRDYYEISKRISFKYGEIVEVLDTARDDKWLVRKKSDSLQVFTTLLLIRYVHVCNNCRHSLDILVHVNLCILCSFYTTSIRRSGYHQIFFPKYWIIASIYISIQTTAFLDLKLLTTFD